ncbi:unnamed protein product, partial [Discosporangium mesarthrocarpum]
LVPYELIGVGGQESCSQTKAGGVVGKKKKTVGGQCCLLSERFLARGSWGLVSVIHPCIGLAFIGYTSEAWVFSVSLVPGTVLCQCVSIDVLIAAFFFADPSFKPLQHVPPSLIPITGQVSCFSVFVLQ